MNIGPDIVPAGAWLVLAALAAASCVGAVAQSVIARTLPATRATTPSHDAAPVHDNHVDRVRRWAASIADGRRSRKRRPVPPAHVAAWCDVLSRRLRAGHSLRSALANEVPDDRSLQARTDAIRRSLSHGVTVAEAVSSSTPGSAARSGPSDPHLELLCSVIAATADFGGSAAAPIDRVGATLRLRSADGQERDAQSAQARLSAHVLTVVPLATLALLVGTDTDVRHFAAGSLGLAVVTSGIALNLAGWWWMKRIVTGDES